jgi:hypothetical protein
LQPGRLTVEYLAGRRQRYIVPIRLYLTASFLFFAAAQISGRFMQASVADTAAVSPALTPDHAEGQIFISPVLRVDRSDLKDLEDEHFADCERLETHCSAWKRWLAPTMVKLQQDPQEFAQRFAERFRHALSYAMFLLLPVFASLLALAYQSRKMYYGEHLIFALHVHSFWFLLALLGLMLPEVVGAWLPLGFLTYGFWSLHRVYGGPWRFTLLTGSLIALTYALAMGIASALLSAALLST